MDYVRSWLLAYNNRIARLRSSDMAAEDKSSPSTLDCSVKPPISPGSPSHLTHFKPLTPEQDEPSLRSAYSSFVNLFRFNKGNLPRSHTHTHTQIVLRWLT
uniref:Uncharacterized protein n=1 Tax=Hucho hucho TaxID=62062 RepID=A0A4W5LEZ3_9TELE